MGNFFGKKFLLWLLIPLLILTIWLIYGKIVLDPDPEKMAEQEYAGSAGCIDCHEKFYKLWAPSHHGLAMQTITSEFINEHFPAIKSEPILVDSSLFHVEIINDSLQYVEDRDGQRTIYPAVYALGGKNVFYFLTPFEKGRLQVLPLAFDLNRDEWYNNPKSALRGFTNIEDEILPWKHIGFTFNTSCYGCHVSQLQNNYNLASNTYHSTWKENGINCETCHGPSAEHIRVCMEAGEGVVPQDLKIIRTSLFEPEQHNSSCGTCHAKMRPITASYKPGERFFDHYDLTTLENPDFYPDGRDLGENYTYTSWLQSRCVSEGGLDCIHCHTSSGRYRFAKNDPYNACLPCHEDVVDQVESHSFHKTDTGNVTCISCHMPMTEFARMHRSDHSMRPPSPLASEEFGSPNACISCHDDKSNAWAQSKLVEWGKNGHQEKMIKHARLLDDARQEKWDRIDEMLKLLDSKEFDEVYSTSMIRLLRSISTGKKWPVLVRAAEHPSPLVRSAVATSLADWQSTESAKILSGMCRDDYRLVRVAAAQSLSSMPDGLTASTDNAAYFSALNEYIHSITARPDDWSSQATLGNFYFNRQDYDKAIRHYNYSTSLFPENVGAYVNCGFVYTMKGNLTQAEAQFRKALSFEPENEGANLNYALLLGEMGRMEEADQAYRKVLHINPASPVAAYNLSVIASSKNMSEAIGFAEMAVRNDPENPKYPYTLSYFLYQQGEYARAENVLRKMTGSFPAFGDAYLLLYEIYSKTGRLEDARKLSEEASKNSHLHESYRIRFSQLVQRPSR